MKRIFLTLLAVFSLWLGGCARINPRLDQKIDNQNGKIEELKNNQNGVMLELGKVRQQAEIQNSQLKEVQQGMINLNTAVSRNENSGVQVLQGDGPMVLIFGLGVVALILYHYRQRAIQSEKAVEIMAAEVARFNNPELNDGILRAAMYTDSEKHIYRLLTKNVTKNAKPEVKSDD